MLINYSYHIWFKACKPFKYKYNLSTNVLLVLNGSYCYYKAIGKPFTITHLLRFVYYYNHNKVKRYIDVLIDKGYIDKSDSFRGHEYYNISSKGIEVITELNKSYEEQLYLFCSKYNIVL